MKNRIGGTARHCLLVICCLFFAGCVGPAKEPPIDFHGKVDDAILKEGEKSLLQAVNKEYMATLVTQNPEFLLETIKWKYERLAILLVKNGFPLTTTDRDGNTPLIFAVGNGLPKLCQELVRRHVNLEDQENNGHTAVMFAALGDGSESIRVVFGYNNRPRPWRQKPYDKILCDLLRAGADPNHANRSGETVLDVAERYRRSTAIMILKRYGAHEGTSGTVREAGKGIN